VLVSFGASLFMLSSDLVLLFVLLFFILALESIGLLVLIVSWLVGPVHNALAKLLRRRSDPDFAISPYQQVAINERVFQPACSWAIFRHGGRRGLLPTPKAHEIRGDVA
jgi:hypothetical protein